MKEFSQEFYNWLMQEEERLKNEIDKHENTISKNTYIFLYEKILHVIKKYKEICFRKEDE
jgi:hypothetical protein